MNIENFESIVELGRERRNIEFKSSNPWTDPEFKAKLVKSVLAFTNVRDGGWIIIGVSQNGDSFSFDGMKEEDIATYGEETMASVFAEYADPFVRVNLDTIEYEEKTFLVITVKEFVSIPVICKRDGTANLRRGAIYTRTHRIPESAEVPSQTEMREILDMATEKKIREYLLMRERSGDRSKITDDAASRFASERGDLE